MNDSTSSKKVLSNSIIYTLMGILQKCVSFFLLPLYTAYLTTDDYGVTNIANNFITTVSFLVALSIFSAVMRFYVDLKDDEEKLKRFYGTVIIFAYISSIIWCVLFTVFQSVLSKYVFSGIDYFPVILITLLSLIYSCQQRIYETILKSKQKATKCSILTFCHFLLTVSLIILFVVKFGLGAVGVLLASLIANIIYSLYAHIDMLLKKEVIICFDINLLKPALKYSIPIIPHNLSTQIAMLVSSVLIGNAASLSGLGVYSVASQFGNLADTIQNYVNSAYGPWLYEKLHAKEDNYQKDIRSLVKLIISIIGLLFMGISIFAQDYITVFVNKAYVNAWRYVPLIVGVFTIKIIYYFYVNVLFYYKKASKMLFIATLSGSILNILLSAFFIPQWGVVGSVVADAFAMFLRVAVIVIISKQYEDVGIKLRDFIIQDILIIVFVVVGLLPSLLIYGDNFSFINFAYKCGIVIVYCIICIIMNRNMVRKFTNLIKDRLFAR